MSLAINPIASPQPDAARPRLRPLKVFFRVLRFCRPDWPKLLLILLITPLVSTILNAAIPLLTVLLMDDAFPRRDYPYVVLMVSSIFALSIVFQLNYLIENFTRLNVKMMVMRRMGDRFYGQMLRLSADYHGKHPIGERIFRTMTDVHDAARMIGVSAPMTFAMALQGGITALLTALVDWRPLVAIAVFLPPYFLLAQYVTRKWRRADFQQRESRQRVISQLQNSYSNVMVVKASAREATERLRYLRSMSGFMRAFYRWFFCHSIVEGFIIPAGFGLIYALMTTFIWGYLHMLGVLTLGQWFALQILTTNIIVPLSSIIFAFQTLQREMVSAERVMEVLEIEPSVKEIKPGVQLEPMQGHVAFDRVNFGYNDAELLIQDFNLILEPGKFTAIVGSSGCGKSTLFYLILRFFDPVSGTVSLDGHPLQHLALDAFRRQIGYLPQNPRLFAGTVRDNLRYGCDQASDEDLWEALRIADSEAFVRELPDGLDYVLTEKSQLSGGQKQRLALARALARRPRLLLLDEPFASLDAQTESRIHGPLREFMRDRVCLLVTHHAHTAQQADQVYRMAEGRLTPMQSRAKDQ